MGCGASTGGSIRVSSPTKFSTATTPVVETTTPSTTVVDEMHITATTCSPPPPPLPAATATSPAFGEERETGDANVVVDEDGPPLLIGVGGGGGRPRAGSVLSALSEISNGAPLPMRTTPHRRRRSLRSSTGEEQLHQRDLFNCLDMPEILRGRMLSGSPSGGACEDGASSRSQFRPMNLPHSQSVSQFTHSAVNSTQDLTTMTATTE